MDEDRIFKLQQMNLELTRQLTQMREELEECKLHSSAAIGSIVLEMGGKVHVSPETIIRTHGKCLSLRRDFHDDSMVYEVLDELPELR